MRYVARTPIKYSDDYGRVRAIAPGRDVPEHLVDDVLIACGAIEVPDEPEEAGEADDAPEPPVDPATRPLAQLRRAELDAILAAEAIDAAGARTNAEIVAVIEAARAARSGGGA